MKDPTFVSVDITGNCAGKTIAPMLFIPFVENAFKHGLKNVPSPGIKIKLDCQKDSINFEVKNWVDPNIEVNKDKGSGIGLANTRRRLELLYPGRHEIQIKQENGNYISRLIIKY